MLRIATRVRADYARAASMRWAFLVALAGVLFLASDCKMQPARDQRLDCLQACGRDKDGCILWAMTPPQIQYCDARSAQCNASCSP